MSMWPITELNMDSDKAKSIGYPMRIEFIKKWQQITRGKNEVPVYIRKYIYIQKDEHDILGIGFGYK